MKYSFHPEEEFLDAIDYYDEKGLGLDFAFEVYATIERIKSFPKAWQIIEGNVRRILVNRFPYGVFYSEDEELYIVAVMHLHQHPEYWKHRI